MIHQTCFTTLLILLLNLVGCLTDSGKTSKIENAIGIITKRGAEIFVISADKETVKDTSISVFQPTNLSAAFQRDSLQVIFSGKLETIDPHIRYFGHPLTLDSIKEFKR